MQKSKRYPTRKTLGSSGLEPYRILGKSIQEDATEAGVSPIELAFKSRWDWQTIRRILIGTRRTDFVELIIIAALITHNQEEMEALILDWTRDILKAIRQDIPVKW